MEKDNFYNMIQDKSHFEQGAENKITDNRAQDSVVTDENVTTSHGLAEGRVISDKLNDHKYDSDKSNKPVYENNLPGIYFEQQGRSETQAKGARKDTKHKSGRRDAPEVKNSETKISAKAKGKEDSKVKSKAKLKSDSKSVISKKAGGSDASGRKYQKKTGSKKSSSSKINNGIKAVKGYETMQNDVNKELQGSSGEAAYFVAHSGYALYQKKINSQSNRNTQRFLKKIVKNKYGKGKIPSNKYAKKIVKKFANKFNKNNAANSTKKLNELKQAQKRSEQLKNVTLNVKQTAVKVARKLQSFAKRNVGIVITVTTFLVLVIAVSAGLGSCAMAFSSGSDTYIAGMSAATDSDMTNSDSYFKEKEMLLQETIDNIPIDYPDYDEYIFDLDEIEHDSIKMMAYLSSEFEGYTLDMVQAKLDELFDEMYTLTLTPKTEIRKRKVTKTGIDTKTGQEYTYEVEEEYEWKILEVTLEKKDWDELIENKFTTDDNKEMYEIYTDTGGAHQAFYNPLEVDWTENITSKFGWRIHPTLGYEKFHNGVDIGMPEGTEVHACATGTVITSTYSDTAGNYVVIQDETGYTTHYMHLSSRGVNVGDVVKHGDIIGKVGSTGRSTGPHLHLGVKDANGNWLNPEFLVSDMPYSEP